ncbi:hypothetical protein AYM39_10360 [Methylomonas sp. DH-1]|nr:hypothetical protein AYM39_10360 [Methylomonas sp. DH-1]
MLSFASPFSAFGKPKNQAKKRRTEIRKFEALPATLCKPENLGRLPHLLRQVEPVRRPLWLNRPTFCVMLHLPVRSLKPL